MVDEVGEGGLDSWVSGCSSEELFDSGDGSFAVEFESLSGVHLVFFRASTAREACFGSMC